MRPAYLVLDLNLGGAMHELVELVRLHMTADGTQTPHERFSHALIRRFAHFHQATFTLGDHSCSG